MLSEQPDRYMSPTAQQHRRPTGDPQRTVTPMVFFAFINSVNMYDLSLIWVFSFDRDLYSNMKLNDKLLAELSNELLFRTQEMTSHAITVIQGSKHQLKVESWEKAGNSGHSGERCPLLSATKNLVNGTVVIFLTLSIFTINEEATPTRRQSQANHYVLI